MHKDYTGRAKTVSQKQTSRADWAEAAAEFGVKMRSCREGAGWDQVDLANTTKISLGIIQAMETGRIEQIPGSVFGRGFVRNICRALKHNPEQLLRDFDEIWERIHSDTVAVKPDPLPAKPAVDEMATPESQPPLSAQYLSSSKLWLTLAALVVGASAFFVKLNGIVRQKQLQPAWSAAAGALTEAKSAPAPTADVPLEGNSDAALGEAGLVAAQQTTDKSSDASVRDSDTMMANSESANLASNPNDSVTDHNEAPSVPASSGDAGKEMAAKSAPTAGSTSPSKLMTVSVVVNKDVRIKSKIDGKLEKVQDLVPGSYDFPFGQFVEMLIMDASAVEITFNGKALGSLGSPGRVRRISFARDQEQLRSLL